MSANGHICSSPEIVKNSFKNAGTANAIEYEIDQTNTETLFLDCDHFDSCDSD